MLISALLLSYCHKKQEHLFASLRLCVSASLRETFWLRPSALDPLWLIQLLPAAHGAAAEYTIR
jgi:hypothetical protein